MIGFGAAGAEMALGCASSGLAVFRLFFSVSALGCCGDLNASKRNKTMVRAAYSSGAKPSSARPCKHML
jgi:hypothetical protein